MTRLGRPLVAAVALLALVSGCYKVTFAREVPAAGPVQTERASYYLFGLIGTHEIDVREHCPEGEVRIIRTGANAGTALVTIVTLGIYAPRKVWIQCGAASHARGAPAASMSGRQP